jgi:hypothetical protein
MRKWICNECNFSDYTDAVTEEELDKWLQCSNCGCNEFHLSGPIIPKGTLSEGDTIHITSKSKP